MPPDFLQPCIFSIEEAVLLTHDDNPSLEDKDVEQVFDLLRNYYKKLAQGKSIDVPTSTVSRKQALLDTIINQLFLREDLNADKTYLQNPVYTLGGRTIPSIEVLYVTAFNYLRKSVRFWRKNKGSSGYLDFIRQNMSK